MINEPVRPSAVLTVATTVVCAAPALISSIVLTPGSVASTVTLYDNATTNSGTVLCALTGVANGESIIFHTDRDILCLNGITAVVAGTAATAQVFFSKSN